LSNTTEEMLTSDVKELLLVILPGALARGPRREFQERMLNHVASGIDGIDSCLEGIADVAVAKADLVLEEQMALVEERPRLKAGSAAAKAAVEEAACRSKAAAEAATVATPQVTAAEMSSRFFDASLGALVMDAVVAQDSGCSTAALTDVAFQVKARERLAVVQNLHDVQSVMEEASTRCKEFSEALLDLKLDQENKDHAVRIASEAQDRCEETRPIIFKALYRAQADLVEFRDGPRQAYEEVAAKVRGSCETAELVRSEIALAFVAPEAERCLAKDAASTSQNALCDVQMVLAGIAGA